MNCTSTVNGTVIDVCFFAANHPKGGKICCNPHAWPKTAYFRLRAKPEFLRRLLARQALVAEFSDRDFHRRFAAALGWLLGGSAAAADASVPPAAASLARRLSPPAPPASSGAAGVDPFASHNKFAAQ